MKMKIIIRILLCLVFYQQGVATIYHPIGPNFVSTITTKQRLYYNNLGTRLDCSAIGTPAPVLTWFRTNSSDDRPSTIVQSSELIDVYENGSLFIRPFRDYSKSIHAGTFVCQAENAAGSIQTTPIQLKPQIYDTYEIEVKNTFGFEQSSVILSCEISPPSASSYVHIIGWLEKVNNQIIQLDLRPKTKYNLLSNQNLIIHNITKSDDNRSYACIVHNSIDNDTRQSRFKPLRVRDPSPFGPELSIPNNTEYQAQAGDLIELPCGISSVSTHARISWWKNGIEIDHISEQIYNNSLILQLSPTSSNDSGNYACRIDDELGGRMTSLMSLKVDLPIQCQMSVQHTNFNAGSNAELICTSNSIKSIPIQWEWYHNSKRLSTNNDRYLIHNLTRKHMGMYQCCYIPTSLDSNACCAQTQVRVINSPPFILSDQEQTDSNIIIIPSKNFSHVPIDLNLTIYSDTIIQIDIYKDNQQILLNNSINYLSSGDIFTHYRIYLKNLNDTGLYEYRAKNAFGSIRYSKHINIEGQKPFIQSILNQTVLIGKQFLLACYASGQPNLQLKWIDQTTKQILNTSFLSPILLTLTNTKSNLYTCQANNPYGEDFQQVYINIEIPAKILSITSNKTIKINEKLNIFCLAEGDNQLELNLKNPLKKNLNLIEIKNDYKKNLSFIFENIQMSDNGLYECYAKNNYSEDRSIFEIIVQNIPDRIEQIFIENSNQIHWIKPFDGNAKIFKYILHILFRQGNTWSNETIITINDSNRTYYSFENLYSKCTISIIIEAVNSIGSSLPSNPLHFQTHIQQLLIAPNNLTAVNISSKSVMLTWQYPSFQLCNDSFIEYIIEIIDKDNQTIIETYKHSSTVFRIDYLKSFTEYTFIVYAMNELGPSPKSKPLTIQTLESVPLAIITDLTAMLLNSSSVRVKWIFANNDSQFLNGKFRTFAVTIYENFNMSTLLTIETLDSNLILNDLHSSSQYYISVSICNYFDCGPSSSAINIETPSSNLDIPITISHPINKPLLLNCPLTNSWHHRENSIHQYILHNNSLYIPHTKFSEINGQYQCGSKQYIIQFYNKPSVIHAKIHYTTTNEIGLKLQYSSDIIENLTIKYKTKQNGILNEIHLSPPLLNIRLTNLSCGNLYEIMISANNQVGFSLNEYLIEKTDGSIPSLIQSTDLIEVISNNFIILTMSNWIINQCSILSYEMEIFSIKNSSETNLHRYYSFKNHFQNIKIDNLQSNEDYQLNIKVNSEAGETIKILSFRTTNDNYQLNSKTKNPYLIIIIIIISFIFTLISSIIIFILIKFCRLHLKNTDLFIGQTKKLKPVILSSYPHHYHGTWLKSNNEFTIQNYSNNNTRPYSYTSEDSQGNINPYAVTGCKDQDAWCRENKHTDTIGTKDLRPSTTSSERYFRPIILESSLIDNQESLKRNPLVQIPLSNQSHPSQPLSNVLSTVSSSQGELSSAFTYVPRSKQTSTFNPRKFSYNNNNHILGDQSSSSADSGVHSSYTQSPIIKHSFRKCQLHGFSFDRPLSANANEDQDKHFYATYDQYFAFLKRESTPNRRHQQEQYSLV